MNVATAKNHIENITKVCEEINKFDREHENLSDETGFLCDAVGLLCDYKKVLETEIDKAELKILN